jgi:glycosyltransferase involved in cell wall biosynthesis
MRIAIFYDYFRAIGGAEKLILTLARHLKADVITTDVDRSLIEKMGFQDVPIISLGGLINKSPIKMIHGSIKFYRCDFRNKYDYFIFSGSLAQFASRRHRPNLMYCNSPMRIYYDLREQVISARRNPLSRAAVAATISVLSYFDKRSYVKVEKIVANSRNASGRIAKFLGRDSVIVYPPCDTSRFRYAEDEGYWLSVNRLYPEKRVDVQIDAFRKMPDQRLLVIGDYGKGDVAAGYAENIKKNKPPNVSFISNITEDELVEYYARCRGFITTAQDEDFGLTVVEAMASGKPVIAVSEGGYLESVLDGVTGVFIKCNEDEIINAVKEISKNPGKFREACIRQSKKFDVQIFLREMDELMDIEHEEEKALAMNT